MKPIEQFSCLALKQGLVIHTSQICEEARQALELELTRRESGLVQCLTIDERARLIKLARSCFSMKQSKTWPDVFALACLPLHPSTAAYLIDRSIKRAAFFERQQMDLLSKLLNDEDKATAALLHRHLSKIEDLWRSAIAYQPFS